MNQPIASTRPTKIHKIHGELFFNEQKKPNFFGRSRFFGPKLGTIIQDWLSSTVPLLDTHFGFWVLMMCISKYIYIHIYSISLGLTIHNIYCDKGIFLFHWILCLLTLLGFEKDRIFLDSIDGKLQNPNANVSGSNFGSMGISPT